jgi:hypothetical protein
MRKLPIRMLVVGHVLRTERRVAAVRDLTMPVFGHGGYIYNTSTTPRHYFRLQPHLEDLRIP